MKIACFVVHFENNFFAGTSRCDNFNKFGFPGGKLEHNETLRQCALRESEEEGFLFSHIEEKPFTNDNVNGYTCYYFKSLGTCKILENYKEKNRIFPKLVTYENISSLFNNKIIIEKL